MNGLTLIENYISDDDEQKLIKKINNQTWDKSLNRLTQHYGYKYDLSYVSHFNKLVNISLFDINYY